MDEQTVSVGISQARGGRIMAYQPTQPLYDNYGTITARLANEIFANMFKAGMHSKKELTKYARRVVAEMYAYPETVESLKELLGEAKR